VLLRFHLWLEDVEVERAQREPVSAHTFAPRAIARNLAMTAAATALGTRLFGQYGAGFGLDKARYNQMKKAAFLSLLPTITRVYKGADTLTNVIAKVRIYDQLGVKGFMTAEAAKWENFAQKDAFRGDAIALVVGDNQFDFIRVDILAPTGGGRFGTLGGNVLAGSASNEIDFDDVSSPAAIASNLLSIRLTYYYVMRVPFANWIIHNSWMAARVGQALMLGEATEQRTIEDHVNQYATDAGGMRVTGAASGELRKLRLLSLAGLHCLPISTTYTMRMQSNQFRKFMP
jgi:hypothetical protein